MQPINFPEANARLAENQDEYETLPVLAGEVEIDGTRYRAMQSKWEPSADELARLNSGASISLIVLGITHPPVMLLVDEIPVKS